jgi:hypothetical protein
MVSERREDAATRRFCLRRRQSERKPPDPRMEKADEQVYRCSSVRSGTVATRPRPDDPGLDPGGVSGGLVLAGEYQRNFTMAKSACAGAVAVRPSASAPIAKRIFFIAHSPLCCAFYRRLDPTWRGQKEFSDPTREFVTAQIVV